jgi:hypothetical protein
VDTTREMAKKALHAFWVSQWLKESGNNEGAKYFYDQYLTWKSNLRHAAGLK